MKKLFAIFFALLMIVGSLAACGKKTLSGTYVLKTVDGKTPLDYLAGEYGVTKDDVLASLGADEKEVNSNLMTMEFRKDGTVAVGGFMETFSGKENRVGTWELGKRLVVYLGDETLVFRYEDGKIYGDLSGEGDTEMVFVKK